jgi:ribosomal protein S8
MYKSNIGKLLYTINSARQIRLKTVKVPYTSLNLRILELLEHIGLIRGFFIKENQGCVITFKYTKQDSPLFFNIKQVSKETKRIYVNLTQLLKIKDRYGAGVFIISTQKGLFFDYECINYKIGGEILLKINL